MFRSAVFLSLALVVAALAAGCDFADTPQPGASEVHGWRLSTGKRPTRAEYAAVVAACQQNVVMRSQGKPLDACLADLGLKRE